MHKNAVPSPSRALPSRARNRLVSWSSALLGLGLSLGFGQGVVVWCGFAQIGVGQGLAQAHNRGLQRMG